MKRIAMIDIGRTLALIAMAVFHFSYDLEMFGFAPAGMMLSRPWVLFAQAIAGSFIFLSGVSLVLAGTGGINRRKYLWRLGQIGLAALAVTVATYFAMGAAFVRFGILHCLFVCAVIGLPFLRLGGMASALAGAALVGLPHLVEWPLLENNALMWLGLTKNIPFMVDYVPLIPWFGVFLLGMGVAKLVPQSGWSSMATEDTALIRALSWPGRHSLAIYLIHQPVLFGLVYLARMIVS